MKMLVGNETTRTATFGVRHKVTVTFTRIDGLWHAHSALLSKPMRNIRDAQIAVRDRLARMAKGEE